MNVAKAHPFHADASGVNVDVKEIQEVYLPAAIINEPSSGWSKPINIEITPVTYSIRVHFALCFISKSLVLTYLLEISVSLAYLILSMLYRIRCIKMVALISNKIESTLWNTRTIEIGT